MLHEINTHQPLLHHTAGTGPGPLKPEAPVQSPPDSVQVNSGFKTLKFRSVSFGAGAHHQGSGGITAGQAAAILESHTTSLEKVWDLKVGQAVWGSPAVDSGGTVYTGTSEGKICALKDGIKQWEYDTGGHMTESPTLGPDGTLYIGNWDNKLVAVKEGKKLWEFQTENYVATTPFVSADNTVYFANDDGNVYAVKEGEELWKFNPGTGMKCIRSSPVADEDGTVYFGSFNDHIYAVKDGEELWKFDTRNLVKGDPVPGPDGTLYVTSDIGKLFALDKKDGSVKWEYEARGIETTPYLGPDGTVYLGCSDSTLRAVKDGKEQWKVSGLANFTVNSPALTDDGKVIAGTDRNTLCVIKNGAKKCEISLPDQVKSRPAVGPDGTIYTGCMDGRIYAWQFPDTLKDKLEQISEQQEAKGSVVDTEEWIIIDNVKLPKN